MKTRQDGFFPELEPPAGGAERFRQRLEADGDASNLPLRPFLAAGVAVAALVIAAVVALREPEMGEPQELVVGSEELAAEPQAVDVISAPEFDRLLGRPLETIATTVAIDNMPVTLTEVPGTRPGIRIYEVRTN